MLLIKPIKLDFHPVNGITKNKTETYFLFTFLSVFIAMRINNI